MDQGQRTSCLPPTLTLPVERVEPGDGGLWSQWMSSDLDRAYRLVHEVGTGGFATVWMAEDLYGGRVAVKVLNGVIGRRPSCVTRFLIEAQCLHDLAGHPHVLPLLDSGLMDGQPAIVTRLCQGTIVEACRGSVAHRDQRAVQVMAQVLDALHASHAQGILHRDVKARNVLVDDDGQARLADFGISWHPQWSTPEVGVSVGTQPYVSPRAREGRWSEEADLYAVAVTLYNVTSKQPRLAKDLGLPPETSFRQEALAQLPPAIRPVVDRATNQDGPGYASALDMRDALDMKALDVREDPLRCP